MKHLTIALLISGVAGAQEIPKPHVFNDKTNLALFSADVLVRTLDFQSTRMLLTNPCKCFYEKELPPAIAQSSPKMLGYSLAVAGAGHIAAYLAHRSGHHKLERLIPLLDIANDSRDVISNYAISGRRPNEKR